MLCPFHLWVVLCPECSAYIYLGATKHEMEQAAMPIPFMGGLCPEYHAAILRLQPFSL